MTYLNIKINIKTTLIFFVVFFAFSEIIFTSGLIQKVFIYFFAFTQIVVSGVISKRALSIMTLFFIYSFYALISAFFYFGNLIDVVFIFQSLLTCNIIYIAFSGLNFNDKDLDALKKIAYFIICLQILFSWIKFILVGIDEPFLIGTMSHSAGQLSLLFPAVSIPILFFLMNRDNRIVIFCLIFFLFAFSIIGEKRAAIFILPSLIITSYIFIAPRLSEGLFSINKYSRLFNLIFKNITLLIFVLIISILAIQYIPSLNKEEISGGSVSLTFIFDFAISYLTMDYGSSMQGDYSQALLNNDVQVGRITLLNSIFEWIKLGDLKTMLFGLGYGSVTPNSWIQGEDILFLTIGTRGAISGFGLAIIETGIVGSALISIFLFYIPLKIMFTIKKLYSNQAKRWFRMLILVFLIFIFDFFLYSVSLMRTMPLPLIFILALSSITIVQRIDTNFKESELI